MNDGKAELKKNLNPPSRLAARTALNQVSSSPPPREFFGEKLPQCHKQNAPLSSPLLLPGLPPTRPPNAGVGRLPPPTPCRVDPRHASLPPLPTSTRPGLPLPPYPPRSRSRPRSPKPLIAPGGVGERQRNAGRGDGEGLGVRGDGPARGGCVSEESLCATSLLWWDTKGEEVVSGSETRWTSAEGTAGLSVGSRAREVWRHQRLLPPGSRHKMAAAAPTRFSYVTGGPTLRKLRPSKIPTPIPGSQLRPKLCWRNSAPRGRQDTKGA